MQSHNVICNMNDWSSILFTGQCGLRECRRDLTFLGLDCFSMSL
jgi:hypothetical protein